jgi:hypothetical protein
MHAHSKTDAHAMKMAMLHGHLSQKRGGTVWEQIKISKVRVSDLAREDFVLVLGDKETRQVWQGTVSGIVDCDPISLRLQLSSNKEMVINGNVSLWQAKGLTSKVHTHDAHDQDYTQSHPQPQPQNHNHNKYTRI